MTHFKNSPTFLLVLFLLATLTSCVDPMSNQATIVIGNISEGDSVATGEFFTITLEVEKGRRSMESLDFLENGSSITDPSRILVNGTEANSLPIVLEGDEKDELDWVVNIEAPLEIGSFTYTISIRDEDGEVSEKDLQLTTFDRQFPPSLSASTQTSSIGTQMDFLVSILSLRGTSDLNSFEIRENDQTISDLDRLMIGGLAFSSNPLTLAEKDSAEFSTVVRITSPPTTGEFAYTFVIKDDNGLTRDVSLNIQVN